jgi:rubrerythrin
MRKLTTQAQVNETVEYVCQLCDNAFFHTPPAPLACPSCGNSDRESLMLLSEALEEDQGEAE